MQTPMLTAFAMMSMRALAAPMPVAFATAPARFTSVDAKTFLKETAIAMEISSMPLMFAEGTAQQMPMQMASVTTSTHVWVRLMHAACAMAPARCMNVVVQTSHRGTAIAMAINLTPSAFAEVHAMLTRMRTACVMMSTTV